VLASIVTYNSAELIAPCLEALLACDAGRVDLCVSVADNSPGDETWEALRGLAAAAPNVRAFRSPSNVGWSQGNNLAVEQGARAFGGEFDFVLLLNPDARIEDGSLTAAAAALAEHPRAGIVGGWFREGDEGRVPAFQPDWHLSDILLQFAGWRFPRTRALRRRLAASRGTVEVSDAIVSGAAMVIRWSVFREIGGLDGRYFLYWDDVDVTRTVRERGYSILFCPGLAIHHEGGASSDTLAADRVQSEVRKQRFMQESLHSYVEKWHGPRLARFVAWYEPRVTWRARLLKGVVRPGGPISSDVARSMIAQERKAGR
jgi:GT2 family glycosyltransferase